MSSVQYDDDHGDGDVIISSSPNYKLRFTTNKIQNFCNCNIASKSFDLMTLLSVGSSQIIAAPAVAGVAVGVGVPILLAYVYGVVPVSLCRSGGCGVSASPRGVRIDFDGDDQAAASGSGNGSGGSSSSGGNDNGVAAYFTSGKSTDAMSVDTANHLVGNPSIGILFSHPAFITIQTNFGVECLNFSQFFSIVEFYFLCCLLFIVS